MRIFKHRSAEARATRGMVYVWTILGVLLFILVL